MLSAAGADVTQAVVYKSRDVTTPAEGIVAALQAGEIDWLTVTSSAIARSLINLFGDALRETRLAAISPLTAEVLIEAGYPPAAVAQTYTGAGLTAAILAAERARRTPLIP
jgi:uroporphyrinogen III methyltransferase/synthase